MKLTEREKEIMDLVIQGLSNRVIGEQLSITSYTVKKHLEHIFYINNVSNRIQASIKYYIENLEEKN